MWEQQEISTSCRYSGWDKWAESASSWQNLYLIAKKLCIQVGKPKLNLLWVYASVPPLVGQNSGEMEDRNRRKIWQIKTFFFKHSLPIAFKIIFPVPYSSHLISQREIQNTRIQRFFQTGCCVQTEAIWHLSVTKKTTPTDKKSL